MSESVTPVGIVDELKQSYLDYAMSVIVSRALPDVRDGLKPVHRRILYAMHELANDHNKPHKKSARVVGDVIGKYHPHGDSAAYDAIVRMAQDFSLRYLLVDGQGNFGSMDGDPAAAMRYTEVRMQKLTHQMLDDIEKDTVDFEPNYDGSETMPSVLPARIPNLLINGAAGIAVGMATNMAPHNLTEVMHACLAYADNPDIDIDGLCEHISAPDFPTGGVIYGKAGILDAYKTGKGRLHLRGRYQIETFSRGGERERLVFTEIPYQVNKATLIKSIADLVADKKLEGISEIRDESDKEGVRIAIDLKRGENAQVVVNNLFAQTALESSFSINMVALDEGQPKLLNLKDLIGGFVRHRQEVVTRRTAFELKKAAERGHILEGLAIALANIDAVLSLIKAAANKAAAREALLGARFDADNILAMLKTANASNIAPLMDNKDAQFGLLLDDTGAQTGQYRLSLAQVDAILEMQLHRLTNLEQDKLTNQFADILSKIAHLTHILEDFDALMDLIKDEMRDIIETFGDKRRTDIEHSRADLSRADLIPEQDIVLTLSQSGYAKAQPLSEYSAQKRGGRGKSATNVKEDDAILHLSVVSSHAHVLCFTNRGRVYAMRGFDVPLASRTSRGRPLVNLINIEPDEKVQAILGVTEFCDQSEILFVTKQGTVKRTKMSAFDSIKSNGLIALALSDGDELIAVRVTRGNQDIMLFGTGGKAIRFNEEDIRSMGRTARGVRGINLPQGHEVASALVVEEGDDEILIACQNGYGKRTNLCQFSVQARGGMGVVAIKTSKRNGALIGAIKVASGDDALLITDKGTLVRTPVDAIASSSRVAQGVVLMKVQADETLVKIARVAQDEAEALES